jgi:prolyl 4-hydroxylase
MFHTTPAEFDVRTRNQQARVPYLNVGFHKIDVSQTPWFGELHEHYRIHEKDFRPEGSNPFLLNVDPSKPPALLYEDPDFNARLHQTLQPLHEEWCGQHLMPTACYGMRMYLSGAYLFNHVDRIETHVVSSTLCIAQELEGRWPLYIEDRDGVPHEVDINPGEIVFYESAKLKHGRPYDLMGSHYVGQFIHYRLLDREFSEN